MSLIKYYSFIFCFLVCQWGIGQNVHYYFVEDAFQRSYFNPALNDQNDFSLASGLGLDVSTNGPSISDVTTKKTGGGLIISAADAISKMNDFNDIFGYTSVHTFDVSVNIDLVRISVGHAWKAQGWLQYSRDLAEFVTNGNGAFIGETMQLGPQVDYINYNEVYLGVQKSFGPLSLGVKIKRLSGVEAINTESSKIDLFTSEDIYQLTLDTDFKLNSSRAFDYTDLENFDLNVENFSFDNFLSNNGGWAFDIGASLQVDDKLEVSLSVLDIGGMDWNIEPRSYASSKIQTFDGIDASEYITSEDEFLILDSIEALLDLEETNVEFQTTLPAAFYLGARYKLSDLWTIGALFQSIGKDDRRSNVIGVNATARIFKFLYVGGLYSVKNGSLANIGLHTSLKFGPVVGFLSTDNLFGLTSFKSTNSNIRAGLSLGF